MFTEKDIKKVIQNLHSNKAHGHDMISIRMLKICGKSVVKPPLMILNAMRRVVLPTSRQRQMLFQSMKNNSYENY